MGWLPWEHWGGGSPMPQSGHQEESSEARMLKPESAGGKGSGRRKKQHLQTWPEGERKWGSLGI